MSLKKGSKSRRKFQHKPTNIEELSTLLEHPSTLAAPRNTADKKQMKNKRNRYDLHDSERKGESRSKSVGRSSKSSQRFQDAKSKSVPALPSSKEGELPISRTKSRQLAKAADEAELSLDQITFKVGGVRYEMDGMGDWSTSMKGSSLKEEAAELRSTNRKMFEENNMMRVKNELLLDMVANKSLRITQLEKEVQQLRKVVSKSSDRFLLP